jgi:hypothetical protein
MNNFAIATIIGLGLSVYTPGHAADSVKPNASKPATSSSTASPSTAATSTSSTAGTAAQTAGTADPAAPTGHGKHHHKKVAHKHKDELIGDGEPLSKLGEHKDVDGGFNFDNSKKFVK